MTIDEIQFILTDNNYLKGGTKESAIKVKEFIKQIETIESNSSIDYEEFLIAINTLLAFCFESNDKIPEKWYCDNDCVYSSSLICKGEFNIDKKSENLCPYYKQESF